MAASHSDQDPSLATPIKQSDSTQREQRLCKKDRRNYSEVHKGVPTDTKQEDTASHKSMPFVESPAKVVRRSYQEIKSIFQQLTSFDWDTKDIKNLKQSPDSQLTPTVFWFWLNAQYFPFDAQVQAQQSYFSLFENDVLAALKVSPLETDGDEPMLISKLFLEEDFIKLKDTLSLYQPIEFQDLISNLSADLEALSLINSSAARKLHSTFQ